MNTKHTTPESPPTVQVHLTLHVLDLSSFERSKDRVHRIMEETFMEGQRRVHLSPTEGEIIYELTQENNSMTDLQTFFDKLNHVFISLSSLSPHFTQYIGENDG